MRNGHVQPECAVTFTGIRRHEIYIRHLNEADKNVKKGKGIQDRCYKEYKAVFLRHHPVLEKWFEKMIIAVGN